MNKKITFHDHHPSIADFKSEVINGLMQPTKQIPPKFFYDQPGSQLFDKITTLPEYYPTQTEIGILRTQANNIAHHVGKQGLLIELGSGSSLKIRVLLDALEPSVYLPIDISKAHLNESAQRLAKDYPTLDIQALCADYSNDFTLPNIAPHCQRTIFFPGSSIGNFEPMAAVQLLTRVAKLLSAGGALLVGVDLKKQPQRLHAAYNDSQDITAAFNLNILTRINHELMADFELDAFAHYAFYNPYHGRVEMHLLSQTAQQVTIDKQVFAFEQGESIHTESSYKYTIKSFQQLAKQAGFTPEAVWTDDENLFSVHCLRIN